MVKILPIHELPVSLLERRATAQRTIDATNDEIERLILKHAELEVGDVLEVPDSGLRYELTQASAYVSRGLLGPTTGIILRGRRLYKEGRKAGRTAVSESHIPSSAEKVKP